MSKRLSKKQREQYLARKGMLCPYCDSRQLDALGKPEVDGPTASIETICVACGETWWDIYTLTNIEEERKRQPCQATRALTR
jgi:hypothetical protein